MTKAIATPPGQATTYTALSQAEIDARDAEESADVDAEDDRLAAIEETWRVAEFAEYDKRVARYNREDYLSETLTDSISDLHDWGKELADMPNLTGYPNTHTRPTRPI